MTVSEWAATRRILTRKAGAARPGRWRNEFVPFAVEPMDCLTDPFIRTVVLMAASQVVKALALDTPIATPSGWSTVGDLQAGHYVYSADGSPTRVRYVTEIFRDRQCYEVEFSCGARIVADAGHYWIVERRGPRGGWTEIQMTTQEMVEAGVWSKNPKTARFRIRRTAPLQGNPTALPIDPYLLGVWLGDGASASGRLCLNRKDAPEILARIEKAGYRASWRSFAGNGDECSFYAVEGFFRTLRLSGLIKNKHIPSEYLRAGIDARWSLLQGLVDTDGHVRADGQVSFVNTNERLVDAVRELAFSLGLRPTTSRRAAYCSLSGPRRRTRDSFVTRFRAYDDQPVAGLTRHLASRANSSCRRSGAAKYAAVRSIRAVDSVPVKCISVEHPSMLFLAGLNMIPTRNTEIGLNWVGRQIECSPSPIMWIGSTEKATEKLSVRRFDALFETPELRPLVAQRLKRDGQRKSNSIGFENGNLTIALASSPSDMSSEPVRDVVADEVDRYPRSAGQEGNPLILAAARQHTYEEAGAKTLLISSPTIEGASEIETQFLAGDRRRYHVRCHACGHAQHLVWEQVRWSDRRPETAVYQCERCDATWNDAQRIAATALDAGAEWVAETDLVRTASFHLSQLYSHFISLPILVDKWLRAQGRPDDMIAFKNTVLGLPWSQQMARVDEAKLTHEVWSGYDVPTDALLVLQFADVQKNRIEVTTAGVGPNEDIYPVDHVVLHGKTKSDAVWEQLKLHRDRTVRRADGRDMKVDALGVDCNYEPDHVGKVVASMGGRRARVYACRGFSRGIKAPILTSKGPSVDRAGREFFGVNADASKHSIIEKCDLETGPGRIHFPDRECFDDDYFRQLKAESLVRTYVRGYAVDKWVKKQGEANEALDCLAGLLAVLRILHPNFSALEAYRAGGSSSSSEPAPTIPETPLQHADSTVASKERASVDATSGKLPPAKRRVVFKRRPGMR